MRYVRSQFLFSATHTSGWRNVSQLLVDLRVPSFNRRRLGGAATPAVARAPPEEVVGINIGERRGAMDDPSALPEWLFRTGMTSFGQLSVRL